MASRDFTIDCTRGKFILIAHTQAAREYLSELVLETDEHFEGVVIKSTDVVDLASRLRREGFAINS